ncbi:hypothetical protein V8F06_002382 [Rhypophila decipiens]
MSLHLAFGTCVLNTVIPWIAQFPVARLRKFIRFWSRRTAVASNESVGTGDGESQEDQAFESWQHFLEYEKKRREAESAGEKVYPGIDGIIVCTQDRIHKEISQAFGPIETSSLVCVRSRSQHLSSKTIWTRSQAPMGRRYNKMATRSEFYTFDKFREPGAARVFTPPKATSGHGGGDGGL